MENKKNNGCFVEDYGFETVEKILSMIGEKWKIQIIYHLGRNKVMRYGEIRRKIPDISHKMLSEQLKNLEVNGLLQRHEYIEIPLKVEYFLTDRGRSLLPIYEVIGEWCQKNNDIFG